METKGNNHPHSRCRILQYPSLESVPPELREVLRGWYNDANAYTQRITKDGEKYAGIW